MALSQRKKNSFWYVAFSRRLVYSALIMIISWARERGIIMGKKKKKDKVALVLVVWYSYIVGLLDEDYCDWKGQEILHQARSTYYYGWQILCIIQLCGQVQRHERDKFSSFLSSPPQQVAGFIQNRVFWSVPISREGGTLPHETKPLLLLVYSGEESKPVIGEEKEEAFLG